MSKAPPNAQCPCGSGLKFKRCHGRLLGPTATATDFLMAPGLSRRAEGINLVAFTDEAGNTGLKLFDDNQPNFWTGTLLSDEQTQAALIKVRDDCLTIAQVPELHGTQLKFEGIERVADRIRVFLELHHPPLLFTCIEKRHVASMKLVDTLLDSGINEAVPWHAYWARPLRLFLANSLAQCIDRIDQVEFWDAYAKRDCAAWITIISRILNRIRSLGENNFYDERTVSLLSDAIEWASEHPEPFMEHRRDKLDSPNVVAFSLILDALHDLHRETGAVVKAFIHDEQNEFAPSLRKIYEMLSQVSLHMSASSPLPEIRQFPTFDCDLHVAASTEDVAGLEIIDVLLWLFKRSIERGGKEQGSCAELFETISRLALFSAFTMAQLRSNVIASYNALMAMPLSAEQIAKGQDLLMQSKAARKRRQGG